MNFDRNAPSPERSTRLQRAEVRDRLPPLLPRRPLALLLALLESFRSATHDPGSNAPGEPERTDATDSPRPVWVGQHPRRPIWSHRPK